MTKYTPTYENEIDSVPTIPRSKKIGLSYCETHADRYRCSYLANSEAWPEHPSITRLVFSYQSANLGDGSSSNQTSAQEVLCHDSNGLLLKVLVARSDYIEVRSNRR